MNIFYLNSDPVVAAEKQYNKHVVKMILESAQLLCSAHHIDTGLTDMPQCMPDEYKVDGDSVAAYRNYYIDAKKHCANVNKEMLYTLHKQFD